MSLRKQIWRPQIQESTSEERQEQCKYLVHYDYVNEDEFLDPFEVFEDTERWATSESGYATPKGRLTNGIPLKGKDTTCVVP